MAVDDTPSPERQAAFMSALVTEHFVLQTAASATVTEAASRTSLYVFSLSSSLVAMGFVVGNVRHAEPGGHHVADGFEERVAISKQCGRVQANTRRQLEPPQGRRVVYVGAVLDRPVMAH